jgi:hypothetical protein
MNSITSPAKGAGYERPIRRNGIKRGRGRTQDSPKNASRPEDGVLGNETRLIRHIGSWSLAPDRRILPGLGSVQGLE